MCGIMFDSSQLKSNLLEGIVTRYYNKGLGNISKGRNKNWIRHCTVSHRPLGVFESLMSFTLPAPTPWIFPPSYPEISHVELWLNYDAGKKGMTRCNFRISCYLPCLSFSLIRIFYNEIPGWNVPGENRKELPTSDTWNIPETCVIKLSKTLPVRPLPYHFFSFFSFYQTHRTSKKMRHGLLI